MTRTPLTELGPIKDVASRLRVALQLAQRLVGQWESGQARQPLSQSMAALERELDATPLTVTVCAATPQARAAWLIKLCGASTTDTAKLAPTLLADIELRFGSPSLAVTHEDFRQEYQRPDDLLVACSTMLAVRATSEGHRPRPITIDLPATHELHGLRLLLPIMTTEPTGRVVLRGQTPILRQWLGRSHLILLITDAETPSQASPNGDANSGGQVQGETLGGHLPMRMTSTSEALQELLSALSQSTSWREVFRPALIVDRFLSTLDMLADRLNQELRSQDSRRKTLAWRLSRLAEARTDREVQDIMDSFRPLNEDGFEAFEAQLSERLRERTLPNSAAMNRLSNLMEDLSDEDFSEEAAGKVLRLRVSPDFLQQTMRAVQQLVRDDLRADVEWFNRESLALSQRLSESLEALSPGFSLTSASDWDEAMLWKSLREQIHVDSRYQGELPRRTWFDRLSQGRRPVFGIMMVVSLVGAAFGIRGGLAAMLAPAMLVLFIGGISWTFLSFREERRLILERELLRVRESFGQEVKRLYETVAKEWLNLAVKSVRDVRKQWTREVDQLVRSLRGEQTTNADSKRKELQDKLKVIEQRQRELTGLQQQVQRLQQTAAELTQITRQATSWPPAPKQRT